MASWQTIKNAIFEVHFAGFKANSLELQNSGWSLSIEQQQHRNSVRLAMKHDGAGVYALSSDVTQKEIFSIRPGWNEPYPLLFNIVNVFHRARVQIFPAHSPSAWSFDAIDATPQIFDRDEVNFEDLVPFRTISANAPEIVVNQQSVPELMDLIIKLQDPRQNEIREKRRQEAFRDRGAEILGSSFKPISDVRAQIITLAS